MKKNNLEQYTLNFNNKIHIPDLNTTFKVGTKFRVSGDKDPWYIVGFVSNKKDDIVIYKSWSKYKQRWVYRVDQILSFLFMLDINRELYKDKNDGNIIIVDKKC